jgi:hypothetical protein
MLTSKPLRSLLVLAACTAIGCTSDLSTGAPATHPDDLNGPLHPQDLTGSWTAVGEVPGSSEHWTLATADTGVSGTGTWTGEACCAGTLSIAGFVSGDSVHLAVTHVVAVGAQLPRDPFVTAFHGILASPTSLVGIDGQRFKKD